MAKIVIAGSADCPYFAKAEVLGDSLTYNLPNFKLHKIVIQPNEWDTWLKKTCQERGWLHGRSPIVWRELVDRGGKGILIGGANDFQEYANGYYGIKSDYSSADMRNVAQENLRTKHELDAEEAARLARIQPVHVCITQAAQGAAYAVINEIAQGHTLGADTEVAIRLYDSDPHSRVPEGVALEAQDLAHGLLRSVTTTSVLRDACADCSYVLLLDDIHQEEEESKEDWLKRNYQLFKEYADVISEVARPDVRVLVAGSGPVNFNAHVLLREAPRLEQSQVIAMSRATERRAKALVANKLQVNSSCVTDLIIWGHASAPDAVHADLSRAQVHKYDGAVVGPDWFALPVTSLICDEKWLETEFPQQLAARRSEEEGLMRHASFSSHASAATSMLRDWCRGTPGSNIFSAGVLSQGEYGVPRGLVFSFPVTVDEQGLCNVVQGLELTEVTKNHIKQLVKKLQAESEVVYPPPTPESPPTPEPEPATEARVPSSPPPAEQESAAADESDKMTDDPGTVQDQEQDGFGPIAEEPEDE